MLKDKLYETVEHLLDKSVGEMDGEQAQAFAEGAARLLEGGAFVFPVEGASEEPRLSDGARRLLAIMVYRLSGHGFDSDGPVTLSDFAPGHWGDAEVRAAQGEFIALAEFGARVAP